MERISNFKIWSVTLSVFRCIIACVGRRNGEWVGSITIALDIKNIKISVLAHWTTDGRGVSSPSGLRHPSSFCPPTVLRLLQAPEPETNLHHTFLPSRRILLCCPHTSLLGHSAIHQWKTRLEQRGLICEHLSYSASGYFILDWLIGQWTLVQRSSLCVAPGTPRNRAWLRREIQGDWRQREYLSFLCKNEWESIIFQL